MKNAPKGIRRPVASEPRRLQRMGDADAPTGVTSITSITSITTITDWLDRWLQRVGRGSGSLTARHAEAHDVARPDVRSLTGAPPMPRGIAFLVYSPDAAPTPVPVQQAEEHMWSFFALLPQNPHTSKIALHAAAYLRRLPALNAAELPPHQAACDFVTALRLAADYLGAANAADAFWVDALRRALALSLKTRGLALGEGFELVDAEFLYVLEANMLADLQWHLGLSTADGGEREAFFEKVEATPVSDAAKALTVLDDAQALEGIGLRALLQEVASFP